MVRSCVSLLLISAVLPACGLNQTPGARPESAEAVTGEPESLEKATKLVIRERLALPTSRLDVNTGVPFLLFSEGKLIDDFRGILEAKSYCSVALDLVDPRSSQSDFIDAIKAGSYSDYILEPQELSISLEGRVVGGQLESARLKAVDFIIGTRNELAMISGAAVKRADGKNSAARVIGLNCAGENVTEAFVSRSLGVKVDFE